jgi:hypothetical protein
MNRVIAERMKRHMRWGEKGAQAFLQVRCAVLKWELREHVQALVFALSSS